MHLNFEALESKIKFRRQASNSGMIQQSSVITPRTTEQDNLAYTDGTCLGDAQVNTQRSMQN
jgi:hypothetical protein